MAKLAQILLIFCGLSFFSLTALSAESYYCKSYCAVYYGGRLQVGQGYSGWVESWSNTWKQAWQNLERNCHSITGYSNLHGRLQVSEETRSYPHPVNHCWKK